MVRVRVLVVVALVAIGGAVVGSCDGAEPAAPAGQPAAAPVGSPAAAPVGQPAAAPAVPPARGGPPVAGQPAAPAEPTAAATPPEPPRGSAAPVSPAATAGAATAAAAGRDFVVKAVPPRPGVSSTITFDAQLDFDLNFGGMKTLTSSTQSKRKKVEFLAVEPDGTVRKRITYVKRDTRIVVDGEPKKDPSPIRGKAYLVTWKDDITDVRLANGKPASDEEVKAVRGEEGQLQAAERFGRALNGLRLVEGQPFEIPVIALDKLVTGAFKPRRMVLTYRGRTAAGARIDAEGELASDGKGTRMFLDAKAELVVDDTGWCRSAKITMQVSAELNDAVVGSGAGTGTVTATPLR